MEINVRRQERHCRHSSLCCWMEREEGGGRVGGGRWGSDTDCGIDSENWVWRVPPNPKFSETCMTITVCCPNEHLLRECKGHR